MLRGVYLPDKVEVETVATAVEAVLVEAVLVEAVVVEAVVGDSEAVMEEVVEDLEAAMVVVQEAILLVQEQITDWLLKIYLHAHLGRYICLQELLEVTYTFSSIYFHFKLVVAN